MSIESVPYVNDGVEHPQMITDWNELSRALNRIPKLLTNDGFSNISARRLRLINTWIPPPPTKTPITQAIVSRVFAMITQKNDPIHAPRIAQLDSMRANGRVKVTLWLKGDTLCTWWINEVQDGLESDVVTTSVCLTNRGIVTVKELAMQF